MNRKVTLDCGCVLKVIQQGEHGALIAVSFSGCEIHQSLNHVFLHCEECGGPAEVVHGVDSPIRRVLCSKCDEKKEAVKTGRYTCTCGSDLFHVFYDPTHGRRVICAGRDCAKVAIIH